MKKNSPKGSKDRDLAKQILVITVGLWQNVNPFLRAYVVNKCNKEIQSLLDSFGDKICCWNTDAVYCTEHIPFLDERLGDDIGQFKLEYEGLFRQKGNNYQKVEEGSTTYRGILKCLFSKDFNILTDDLPKAILPYKMNKETYMIEKNQMFKGE